MTVRQGVALLALLLLLTACQPAGNVHDLSTPSGAIYGLTGEDAVLYDGVAALWTDAPAAFCIPRLGLVDNWEEDGTLHHLFQVELAIYDPTADPPTGEPDQYSMGRQVSWVCLVTDGAGESVLETLVSQEGDLWAQSIRQLCGPREQLAEDIIGGGEPPFSAPSPT